MLGNAPSDRAQAEREKPIRGIPGSSETALAGKFVAAATTYADHPAALQLRAINIVDQTTQERGVSLLMPTKMADSTALVVGCCRDRRGGFPAKRGWA